MSYSCHYPIIVNLSASGVQEGEPIEYTIYKGSTLVYKGRVYTQSSDQTSVEIDISDICREYLNVFYENIIFLSPGVFNVQSLPTIDNISSMDTFSVRNEEGGIISEFQVMYNYNTDYISEYPNIGGINEPVLLEADTRQLITLTGYNNERENTFSYQINDNAPVTIPGELVNAFQVAILKINSFSLSEGDKLTVTANGQSHTYTIVPECRNRFALYYVNKNGGLDSILCRGKHVESFNSSRTDVRLYDNRLSRQDFQNKRIYQNIDKKYQLNTSLIDDESAKKIDHLIYSPKVWIHDLEKDTITSCLIDDNAYSVKSFRNDRLVTYQFSVTESQQYIRR